MNRLQKWEEDTYTCSKENKPEMMTWWNDAQDNNTSDLTIY